MRTGSSSHCLNGHEGSVRCVQWTRHHQSHLYSGGQDGTIRIWDVRSSKSCIKIIHPEKLRPKPIHHRSKKRRKCDPDSNAIADLCCSYDGLWLYSFNVGGRIEKWHSVTGRHEPVKFPKISSSLHKPSSVSTTKHLSPNLLYVPNKSEIRVLDCSSGTLVNILYGHMGHIYQTLFNPLTLDLYSYGMDKNFIVWRPKVLYPKEVDTFSEDQDTCNIAGDNWSDDD